MLIDSCQSGHCFFLNEMFLNFLDGIDEMPELQQLLKKTRKIRTLDEEATCLEWCINILRGDILRDATKIVSSR